MACVGYVSGKWLIRAKYRVLKNLLGNLPIAKINMTDPIADMLNRIKNAQAAKHKTVSFNFSKAKYEIASILQSCGLVESVEKKGKKEKKLIKISFKEKDLPLKLKRISKPGQRIYVSAKNIKPVKSGYGISIISTSKGLMIGKKAKKNKLGGEILCEIW